MPPAGGESHTAAKRITKWHPQGAYLSPAQRCFITPEGGSPEPACQAKPITGRTLPAQGRQAQRLPQLERSEVGLFSSGEARLSGFRRQRRHKKWRLWRRTSPVGTVSQPIGKPFNGQAKGLLWLTWRSYAGPPQYFIPPEGGSPEPVREASAGPGQNPWRPGPKARRRHQPSRP